MSKFIRFEKDGQIVFINKDHVHAVHYVPNPQADKQTVTLLGAIVFKGKDGNIDMYGHAVIETVEFRDMIRVDRFVNQIIDDSDDFSGTQLVAQKSFNFWPIIVILAMADILLTVSLFIERMK